MVRREGVLFIVVGIGILSLVMNINHFFNAFTLFLLAGGVPGTSFSFPDLFMLFMSVGALIALILWLFRDHFSLEKLFKLEKNQLDRLAKRRRYKTTS